MHDRDRIAKHKPVGPFEPPLPKDAESRVAEPMAVANDKQTIHGESFVATSAPLDQYDAEVARRYKQVPAQPAKGDGETRAMQQPPEHTTPDARGWSKPKLEGEGEGEEGAP